MRVTARNPHKNSATKGRIMDTNGERTVSDVSASDITSPGGVAGWKRCDTADWKSALRLLVAALLAVGLLGSARADLCSSNNWSGTWGETFTNGGFTWLATNTSPCWLITDTNNYTTWIFSAKGTIGDYDMIIMAAASSTNATPDVNGGYIDRGIGTVVTNIARQ